MVEAARDLCWRQFDLFATSGPYDQATAKLALQPLVNLGRLHTRDGNGIAAYQVHEALFHAAQSRSEAVIDGTRIDLGRIVQDGDDHRVVVRWLWTILLADGIRALCRARHQARHPNDRTPRPTPPTPTPHGKRWPPAYHCGALREVESPAPDFERSRGAGASKSTHAVHGYGSAASHSYPVETLLLHMCLIV
ncbi:hypothetical protein ACFHYQ_24605 [Sphaerimonospora cavernae]|uniref:Uncharacterized protein n=1 Tax=Sphaerimonospora cavernae TaxID=1740611 RepID=A0ABV6UBA9_9ACTN